MLKDYSQYGEQRIVEAYFAANPPLRRNFLDIGANDGITLSNTYGLVLAGWTGTYVEPDPAAFSRLRANLAGSNGHTFLNVAIGRSCGKGNFYSSGPHLPAGDDTGLVSTALAAETRRWGSHQKFKTVEVDFKTAHAAGLCDPSFEVDFLSIDAEGMDWAILQQLKLATLRPKLVCIEWNGLEKLRENISWFMAERGYHFHYRNYVNLIYKRCET